MNPIILIMGSVVMGILAFSASDPHDGVAAICCSATLVFIAAAVVAKKEQK